MGQSPTLKKKAGANRAEMNPMGGTFDFTSKYETMPARTMPSGDPLVPSACGTNQVEYPDPWWAAMYKFVSSAGLPRRAPSDATTNVPVSSPKTRMPAAWYATSSFERHSLNRRESMPKTAAADEACCALHFLARPWSNSFRTSSPHLRRRPHMTRGASVAKPPRCKPNSSATACVCNDNASAKPRLADLADEQMGACLAKSVNNSETNW